MRLEPRFNRFQPIDPVEFVAVYLAKARGAVALTTTANSLSPYLDKAALGRCLAMLKGRGEITREDGQLRMGPEAVRSIHARLGKDEAEPWNKLLDGRFILMALGMDPDDRLARIRKGRSDQLRAMVIAVGYGLKLPPEKLTATSVRAEMVTRILRMHMPDIVGQEPLPIEGKATALERVLLGGFVGIRARNITEAWAALAAAAAGLEDKSIEALRKGLVHSALTRGGAQGPDEHEAAPEDGALTRFAERVLEVARQVAEDDHRFAGRVAIAAVYDIYGRSHPDAGRIAEFKTRLVEAARRRELSLERLDLPELLTEDERARSAAPWDDDHRHLIVTEI